MNKIKTVRYCLNVALHLAVVTLLIFTCLMIISNHANAEAEKLDSTCCECHDDSLLINTVVKMGLI